MHDQNLLIPHTFYHITIAMVMQTTLMDYLHVLHSPSTGLGQEGATRGQRTFKLLLSFLRYCKNTKQVDIT